MAKLDTRAVWLLFGVLALTAAISFANGVAAALRAPRAEQVSAGVDPSRDPVPNASALTAPALDETRIRAIAHEEALAALAPRKRSDSSSAAAKPAADAESKDDAASPDAPKPAVPLTPPTAPPSLTQEPSTPRIGPG